MKKKNPTHNPKRAEQVGLPKHESEWNKIIKSKFSE
jgi:hypothetical protein